MVKKKSVDEIYIIRALAIIGVLMVHSSSTPATQLSSESAVFPLYNFANIFFKFGTPTFIMLSSFVLFYNYFERDISKKLIRRFYKKRILYILIPYLLFSTFYFTLVHVNYYPDRALSDTIAVFIEQLLTGNAYSHLYFVFISVQFYILFPFLLMLCKKYHKLTKHLVLLGLVIQWGFVLVNKYYIEYPYKGSIALSYFSYYLLGAYIGIYFEKIKKWLVISKENYTAKVGIIWALLWSAWLTFSFGYVKLWLDTRVTDIWQDALWYELFWNAHTYLSALVLIQAGFWIYAHAKPFLANALIHLGVASFGVYLIHPYFLFIYDKLRYTGSPLLYHLWAAGGFVFSLGVSWLIVGLTIKYVKGAWVVFGATPKHMPYKTETTHTSTKSLPM